MVYFLAALAVFKLTQFVRHFVEAPAYVEFILIWVFTVGLSALILWIAGANPAWCLAVAAGAGLLHRFETLLMTGADAAKVAVLRSTRRR